MKQGAAGKIRGSGLVPWALALPPLGIITAAFILPYAAALGKGLEAGAGSFWENPAVWRTAAFSVKQAALSVLLALALGLPGAWIIGAGRFRGGRLVRALAAIPFAMPPILVVLGFVLFFGNSGWFNKLWMALSGSTEGPFRILYKPSAIILAHGFYNFPLILRLAGDGIAEGRASYAPAASTLGASPLIAALTVLFPLALPSIMAASLLAFLYSFTSFAVVLVLGGGPAASTLAVEIYRYARIRLDYGSAGSLALLETLIAAAVFLAYLFFQGKARTAGGRRAVLGSAGEGRASWGKTAFVIFYVLGMAFFVLGPLFSVPLESFLYRPSRAAGAAVSLRWWLSLGDRVLPALGRSLLLAALSASLAGLLAALASAAAFPSKLSKTNSEKNFTRRTFGSRYGEHGGKITKTNSEKNFTQRHGEDGGHGGKINEPNSGEILSQRHGEYRGKITKTNSEKNFTQRHGGRRLISKLRLFFLFFLQNKIRNTDGRLPVSMSRGPLRALRASVRKKSENSLRESLIRIGAAAPLASSGIVLGLGYLILYGRERQSLWILAALHAVSALPFAFHSIYEGLQDIPENTLNAASVFGAGPVKRLFTVALPLSFRRLRSAWGFAAALSLGELNAVLILGMENWETLPLLIYRAAGAYRYGTACAAGSLLILGCTAAFLLSDAGEKGKNHGP